MIRVLITLPLDARDVDLLNEIPEFEINEKADLSPAQLLEEIPQADAIVCGAAPPLAKEAIAAAAGLKLIVAIGTRTGVDAAAAGEKGIEVRPVRGGRGEAARAIAVLKDFFNV